MLSKNLGSEGKLQVSSCRYLLCQNGPQDKYLGAIFYRTAPIPQWRALDQTLQRLQHRHGICGTVLNWFRSYLSNRTQLVRIQEVDSSDKILLYGVPQGSVLGPLLFTLFFAPLEDVIYAHELDAMMCADDTQLYITIIGSSDQRPIALSKLELCINDIMISCTSNGLTCNPDKTEIVHFTEFTSRFSNLQDILVINISGCTIWTKKVVLDLCTRL